MSKQSKAKEAQGYTMEQSTCANCTHYSSKVVEIKGIFGGVYCNESNKRCSIGGFAVKKTATCKKFEVAQ